MKMDWQKWSAEAQRLMQQRNDAWKDQFGLSDEPYNWDMDSAQITFQKNHGAVVADITLVGTLSHPEKSFLWAWADGEIPEQVIGQIERIRDFGTQNDLDLLINPCTPAGHPEALELAIIAGRVLDAQGLFVDKCDDLTLYFLLFGIRLESGAGSCSC